jgi:hypothetical protein
MPRIWHLPSQVGEYIGVPFLWNIRLPFEPLSSRTLIITGATPSRVFKSLLSLILGCSLILCFGYYSSDLSFLFTTKGWAHTLRKAPDSSGSDISVVISLCVFCSFLLPDFFSLVCAKYHGF